MILIILIIFCINLIFLKKDEKRIKKISNFYKEKGGFKKFNEKDINEIFYYDGKQAVLDI